MRALACAIVVLTPAVAFAQEASKPPIDWSKPVIGVDSNIVPAQEKSAPLPVEIYTLEQLQELDGPSVKEFVNNLRKLPESCDMQKQGGTVTCAPKPAPAPTPDATKAQR